MERGGEYREGAVLVGEWGGAREKGRGEGGRGGAEWKGAESIGKGRG